MSDTPDHHDVPEESADEQAFWDRMQSQMAAHGRPAGASMPRRIDPAALRRRAAREAEGEHKVIQFRWWAMGGWAAAAAAVVAAVVIANNEPSADSGTLARLNQVEQELADTRQALVDNAAVLQQLADERDALGEERDALAAASTARANGIEVFLEDGSAVSLPDQEQFNSAHFMPVRNVAHIDAAADLNLASGRIERPWLGVWTRPVTIEGLDDFTTGLSVVRVASGSPAAEGGIKPGDVIVDLGDCPLATRFCIMKALASSQPGDTVPLRYFRPGVAGIHHLDLDLAAMVE